MHYSLYLSYSHVKKGYKMKIHIYVPSKQFNRERVINSLAPGGFENIFQNVFFKLISWIDTLSNSCETALRSMPQNPSDDKSTLVQVMAWCHQAASHYLSQCCPKSLSPYGVTRPQWVNSLAPGTCGCNLKLVIFKLISRIDISRFLVKLPLDECQKPSLMISQHWIR